MELPRATGGGSLRDALRGAPPLVVAGLASLTGPLADALRAELAKKAETACLVEILGGTSAAHAVAAYWRQLVMDWFLVQYAVALGVHEEEGELEENLDRARPGLFELVCWMRTEEQRATLRAMLGSIEVVDVGDRETPVRGGGALSHLLDEAAKGGLCAAWSDLDCATREAITTFINNLGCEPAFFDEDFDLQRPDDYTGLTDAEEEGDREWPPPWLEAFPGGGIAVPDVNLYSAVGVGPGAASARPWAERVLERLPPLVELPRSVLGAARGVGGPVRAPGWAWP